MCSVAKVLANTGPWTERYLNHFRGAHHVPEMGTKSACGLVVLHHTVIVENLPTAFTVRQTQSWSVGMSCDTTKFLLQAAGAERTKILK